MALFSLALVFACLASAQVPVDPEAREALTDALKAFQERYKPAQADADEVQTLYDRLSKLQDPVFTESETAKEGKEHWTVRLNEVDAGDEGYSMTPEGLLLHDGVFRRSFTHLEGVSERHRPLKSGGWEVDMWVYTVSLLDGKILQVTHAIIMGKPDEEGEFEADPKRSRVYRMSPGDPHVLQRWKRMSERFLKMGPTQDA